MVTTTSRFAREPTNSSRGIISIKFFPCFGDINNFLQTFLTKVTNMNHCNSIICYFCAMELNKLVGHTLSEIEEIVSSQGFDTSLGVVLATAIYRKRIGSFEQIDGLPKRLKEKLTQSFEVKLPSPERAQISKDGTIKYLFQTRSGNPFETAFMPGGKRNTLCISTQSGCRMGCSFCQTGNLGFLENLSASDIVGQLVAVQHFYPVNRVVLMGMGEPLDNFIAVKKSLEIFIASWGIAFGAAKITLSTIGVIPELKELIGLKCCNVAVSLHSPWPKVRKKLIPAENIYPLYDILKILRENPMKKPLRLSFEYLIIPGINDSPEDATEVARILSGHNSHVNIIPYNNHSFKNSSEKSAKAFQRLLNDLGQPATFRISRGYDISAACGMMAGES